LSVLELPLLKAAMVSGARLFGLDLGEKVIGLALSDTLLSIASPFGALKRGKFSVNARELLTLADEHGVRGLVLGLPLNMDGSEGPSAQSARAFARNLARLTDIPIVLWDERLSTAAVTRTLIEADSSRRRRAQVIDKMAAAYILQGALDRLRAIAAS
jgi:putative Holliday junction resolvase